jgi:hypothetical protein
VAEAAGTSLLVAGHRAAKLPTSEFLEVSSTSAFKLQVFLSIAISGSRRGCPSIWQKL